MRIIIAAVFVAALPAIARAQSTEHPLPPFTLADAGGAKASSATLAAGGRAVVVFVKPSCRPCERLLESLARLDDPTLASRIVLVVESPLEDAATFAARRLPPELGAVRWFADADNDAWTALDLNGLPKVIGLEGQEVAWAHSGVPERSLLESLMRTWIGSEASR